MRGESDLQGLHPEKAICRTGSGHRSRNDHDRYLYRFRLRFGLVLFD